MTVVIDDINLAGYSSSPRLSTSNSSKRPTNLTGTAATTYVGPHIAVEHTTLRSLPATPHCCPLTQHKWQQNRHLASRDRPTVLFLSLHILAQASGVHHYTPTRGTSDTTFLLGRFSGYGLGWGNQNLDSKENGKDDLLLFGDWGV